MTRRQFDLPDGRSADTRATLRWRRCNALFFSGLPILAGLVFALLLLLLRGEGLLQAHLKHLHVVLGSAVVGGQFFLALAFARVMAANSFRQREFGFETIERLFGVWLVLAVLQPVLGLCCSVLMHRGVPPHVWLALALYRPDPHAPPALGGGGPAGVGTGRGCPLGWGGRLDLRRTAGPLIPTAAGQQPAAAAGAAGGPQPLRSFSSWVN